MLQLTFSSLGLLPPYQLGTRQNSSEHPTLNICVTYCAVLKWLHIHKSLH